MRVGAVQLLGKDKTEMLDGLRTQLQAEMETKVRVGRADGCRRGADQTTQTRELTAARDALEHEVHTLRQETARLTTELAYVRSPNRLWRHG
jgi:cell division protein FtsB